MNDPVVSMLSTSFFAVPDLRRVDPATISGPASGAIGNVDGARQFRIGRATDSDGDGAEAPGFGDRAQHIRRAPAGRDADEHIACGEAAGEQVADADGGVVFGGLGGAAESATRRPR